ncbi:MAG: hypothetical protein PHP57_03720 [Sideroxydans sp.]|nr:hypothetical protein [Sideroxydans sp.]
MKNKLQRVSDFGFCQLAKPPARSGGFSIITAIFLLVVLSFLGVAMVSFSTVQHQSEMMDVMGARAYQAARAGVEWSVHNVTQMPTGTRWAGCEAASPARTFAANELAGETLSAFTVRVNCSSASFVEGTSTVWVYAVSSVATMGIPNDQSYVERVINVKLAW